MVLTKINGIGDGKAKKLVADGIDTLEKLAAIEDLNGYSIEIHQSWIDQAKLLLGEAESQLEPNLDGSDSDVPDASDSQESLLDTNQGENLEPQDNQGSGSVENGGEGTDEDGLPGTQQSEPNDQEAEEQREPILVAFPILSGAHKGKAVQWKEGNPALTIGRAGQYVDLAAVLVSNTSEDDGVTKFKFTWGETVGSAELLSEEFSVFSEAVKKKRLSRPQLTRAQG